MSKNNNLLFTTILPRSFYQRPTVQVAQELLGCYVVREYQGTVLAGMIVETEAYTADDQACHAFKGKTKRNAALFGPVGCAYVYFIYGNHYCLNAVSRDAQSCAGGVLIRALEPIAGIETMQQLRNQTNIIQLTNGPGKIGQALALTTAMSGHDLTHKGELYICAGKELNPQEIIKKPRIGISKAQDLLHRFYIKNNAFVSKL